MCVGFSLHAVLPYILCIYVANMNTPALKEREREKEVFHSSNGAWLVHLGNTVIRSWSDGACGPSGEKILLTLVASGGR